MRNMRTVLSFAFFFLVKKYIVSTRFSAYPFFLEGVYDEKLTTCKHWEMC